MFKRQESQILVAKKINLISIQQRGIKIIAEKLNQNENPRGLFNIAK